MDVNKLISYWSSGADEELLNAGIMLANNRLLPGLFFCHLSIEKILKALVVKNTGDHAVKTHKLSRLAEIAGISFSTEQKEFMALLTEYQLEGRYPDKYPDVPSVLQAEGYFEKTKTLLLWLKEML